MDESRAQAIDDGANVSTGSINFNYVDTNKLERMGIGRYSTKKPKGENFIRIVAPSKKGAFAREIWKHDHVGADDAVFLCLEKMFGEPCPVCKHIQELKKSNINGDTIKELTPNRRFLLFVVDTTSSDTEAEGPKWFDCPPTIYKEVCTRSKDRRTGEKIDPSDPEDGRDIEFVRQDGKTTRYVGVELKPAPPVPKSWYEDLPPFDEILLRPDPKEVEEAISGTKSSTKESRSDGNNTDSRGSRGESRGNTESRRSSRGESRDSSNDEQKHIKEKIDEIRERKSRARNDE